MSLEGAETYGHPPVYVDAHEAAWLQSPVDNLSGLDRHSDLMDVVCQPAEEHFDYRTDYHLKNFHFMSFTHQDIPSERGLLGLS